MHAIAIRNENQQTIFVRRFLVCVVFQFQFQFTKLTRPLLAVVYC